MLLFVVVSIASIIINKTTGSFDTSQCKKLELPKPGEVPKFLRSWKTPFPEYEPTIWTVQCTEASCDPTLPYDLTFKKKQNGFDRRRARTCLRRPDYEIGSDGYPLNPAGRTGIAGRGILKHWGPNHLVKVALVRKDKSNSTILLEESKGHVNMPEAFVNSMDDSWYGKETEEKIINYLTESTGSRESSMEVIKKAQKKSITVLSGSIPSGINTDNAWVELHLRVVDCKKSDDYCNAVATALSEQNFKWMNTNEASPDKPIALNSNSPIDEQLNEDEQELYSVYCNARNPESVKAFLKANSISSFGMSSASAVLISAVAVGGLIGSLLGILGVLILIPCAVLLGISLHQHFKCD